MHLPRPVLLTAGLWFAAAAGLSSQASLPPQSSPPVPQSSSSQQTPVPPTFRTTTDVVAVDVTVIDNQGRPIVDLAPGHFTLKVDGQPRKIRSAEFVSLRRLDEDRSSSSESFTTNESRRPGRLIMLVVDQGHITKGSGKEAFRAASKFIDSLGSADRVAIQVIPGTGPVSDFTSDRAAVKAVLERTFGQAIEAEHSGHVGISESIAVSEGNDEYAWQGILERECVGFHDPDSLLDCRSKLGVEVRDVYTQTLARTRMSLLSLRSIIERLSLTSEPKTVVLISEGIVLDQNLNDITWVGPRTAAANVSVYGIRLSSPQYIVTMGRTSPTREADQRLMQEGMDLLVGYGRGSVYPASVNATASFSRLALELSGYYLLSFEPAPGDRDGRNHGISVGVSRRGATVRARQQFSAEPAGSVKATADLLVDALRSPLVASDFDLKLTTFTYRDEPSGRLKVVIGAEATGADASGPLAVAYLVKDGKGDLTAVDVEGTLTPAAEGGAAPLFVGAIVLDPGPHTLKLAVVDAKGQRASLERAFDAKLTAVGQIRLGELMLARPERSAARMRPAIDGRFVEDALIAYTELYSEAEPPLRNATLRIEIAATEEGRAIESATMTFSQSRAGKRAAQGSVPLAMIVPGDYVARAVLSVDGRAVGRVTRPLTIVRPAAVRAEDAAAVRPPANAPAIAFSSKMEVFDRRDVLTRPVLAFFIDRLQPAGVPAIPPALLPAIGYARMGRFAEVRKILDEARPDHPAAAFLSGLSSLAEGDLPAAAADFAGAAKRAPGLFPAVFYLGACYAAAGQDREAIRVWQSALVTDPAAPWIHTLLADAMLRQRDTADALGLLREAARLWPGNDDILMRWATALAESGQGDLAIKMLDGYLDRRLDDGDRLLLAMRLIYEARVAGREIESATADRARFVRYFDTYAALGGASIEMARQWRAYVDRN